MTHQQVRTFLSQAAIEFPITPRKAEDYTDYRSSDFSESHDDTQGCEEQQSQAVQESSSSSPWPRVRPFNEWASSVSQATQDDPDWLLFTESTTRGPANSSDLAHFSFDAPSSLKSTKNVLHKILKQHLYLLQAHRLSVLKMHPKVAGKPMHPDSIRADKRYDERHMWLKGYMPEEEEIVRNF